MPECDSESDKRFRVVLSDDDPMIVRAQNKADARAILTSDYGVEASTIVAISQIG